MSGISIAEQMDSRISAESRKAAFLLRLRYFLLWRLSIVPVLDGIRFLWVSRSKLEGVPYRWVTVPMELTFVPGVTARMHAAVPMTVGDILKVSLYQDIPSIIGSTLV